MEFEETIVAKIQSKVEDSKKHIKLFQTGFVFFFIGQILLILSTLSNATIINGVPHVLFLFSLLTDVVYVLFFISAFLLKRFNKSFMHSFYSIIIFIIVSAFVQVCNTSISPMNIAMGRGLRWSAQIVLAVFYLYFFHGCSLQYEVFGSDKAKKRTYLACYIFAVLFVIFMVLTFLSENGQVRKNLFFNRFSLYGKWVASFFVYVFVFVISIIEHTHINKLMKEGGDNKNETK